MLRDLFFRITARDETGRAFASVTNGLKQVEGVAASARTTIKRNLAGIGAAITGLAGATGGLTWAFSDSLNAWDGAERAQAKLANAFNRTGGAVGLTLDELNDLAVGLQAATRFDGDVILDEAISQLLTFGNLAGDEFKRATEMALDFSTLLGTDVKGSAVMLGKALNDPIRGLSALRRVGVQFTEDQEATIASLVETGSVAEAQGAILDEIARQGYGGQARAASEAGLGFLAQFRNAWGDVEEIVGGNLAEIARPLVGVVQTLVQWLGALPAPVQRWTVLAGLAVVALGPLVAAFGLLAVGIAAVGAPVAAAIAGIVALTAAVVAFWPQLSAAAGYVAETVGSMSLLERAFLPVSFAARALWDLFAWAFPDMAGRVVALKDATLDALGRAGEAVVALVGRVKEWLLDRLGAIFETVKAKIVAVGDAFYTLWDRVVGHSYVPDMVDGIGRAFGRLDGDMVTPAVAATDRVGGAFGELGQGALDSVRGMVREGELSFSGFVDRMVDHAARMADGIVDDAFGRIGEAAKGMGGDGGILAGLTQWAGSLFGGGGNGKSLLSWIPGFATGGSIDIAGRSGVDRNLAVMRVSRGENVTVTPKGGSAHGGGVVVNITTPNPAAFEASRGQVAATIARAVGRGQRNL
jgi:hypothetical protein